MTIPITHALVVVMIFYAFSTLSCLWLFNQYHQLLHARMTGRPGVQFTFFLLSLLSFVPVLNTLLAIGLGVVLWILDGLH